MELHIHSRNLEVTAAVKDHVTSKLDRTCRHLPGIYRAEVVMASEPTRLQHDRIVVQVTLRIAGSSLRAKHRGSNTREAINAVARTLDRQIQQYKGHVYRSERPHVAAGELDPELFSQSGAQTAP